MDGLFVSPPQADAPIGTGMTIGTTFEVSTVHNVTDPSPRNTSIVVPPTHVGIDRLGPNPPLREECFLTYVDSFFRAI